MDIINIWNVLGIFAVILLVIYFICSGRNAVWGGLTLGLFVGLIINLVMYIGGNGFSWSILKKVAVVGTLNGFLWEIVAIVGTFIAKRKDLTKVETKSFPLSGLFEEEIKKFNYILTTSYPDISEEDVDEADKIGLKMAIKAFKEVRKGHKALGWIKAEGLSEAKEASSRLNEYAEKDGNLDFFFGWCFAIGRDYGYGTPEKISETARQMLNVKR